MDGMVSKVTTIKVVVEWEESNQCAPMSTQDWVDWIHSQLSYVCDQYPDEIKRNSLKVNAISTSLIKEEGDTS